MKITASILLPLLALITLSTAQLEVCECLQATFLTSTSNSSSLDSPNHPATPTRRGKRRRSCRRRYFGHRRFVSRRDFFLITIVLRWLLLKWLLLILLHLLHYNNCTGWKWSSRARNRPDCFHRSVFRAHELEFWQCGTKGYCWCGTVGLGLWCWSGGGCDRGNVIDSTWGGEPWEYKQTHKLKKAFR